MLKLTSLSFIISLSLILLLHKVVASRISENVCCPNKFPCCPNGTFCDSIEKLCISKLKFPINDFNKLIKMLMVPKNINMDVNKTVRINNLKEIKVFKTKYLNGTFSCSVIQRCPQEFGKFGCCPFDKGVCCSDLTTCCPSSMSCDLRTSKCVSSPTALAPFPSNYKRRVKRISTTLCPDDETECPSWETCCQVSQTSYGCCPFENATCCADQTSCCPQNQKCDLQNNKCVLNNNSPGTVKSDNLEQKVLIFNVNILITDRCPTNHTCCSIGRYGYEFCPYYQGVCCQESRTCCPKGTRCRYNRCI